VNRDAEPDTAAAPPPSRLMATVRLAIVPALIIGAVIAAWRLGYFDLDRRQDLGTFAARMHALRWSEVAYVVLYSVAIAMVLPAALVTLLGGAVFGTWEGAGLAWLGAMGGTCVAHLLARRVLRSAIQRTLGEHRLLRRLRERADVMALFRLRILPVAPFATLDYIAGIAGISLRRLLAATAVGVVPSVVAYSYVGAELMHGVGASHGQGGSHRALLIAAAVTLTMLLLSTVPMLIHRERD
jgi:uncharacterized membrane protein YdjX (TVP38/TMEM64 family)